MENESQSIGMKFFITNVLAGNITNFIKNIVNIYYNKYLLKISKTTILLNSLQENSRSIHHKGVTSQRSGWP